jgi:N-acetylglutamate synthase-like GNAT family acetyltransferase
VNFTIEYSNDHTDAIKTIAKWHYDRWHNILPNFTLASYAEYLSSHYRRGGIPALFVAADNGKVIGTAALEDDDMDTHPALSPWLASLYVDGKYRKKGAGTALVNRVIDEARSARAEKLYLFTPDREHYFSRFGWRTLFKEDYYGEAESVMVLNISPHTPSW